MSPMIDEITIAKTEEAVDIEEKEGEEKDDFMKL